VSGERVLIVDDEARFRRALAISLEGHSYRVRESATGAAGLEDFDSFRPDVVLLDLMLPDTTGVNVCRKVREKSDVPIIVLSVLGDEKTKVGALDEGADDYLTKPFGTRELLARIRAALRRPSFNLPAGSVFTAGPLTFDLERELVFVDGEEVHLTPTEMSLLRYFIENAGKVLRHQAILRHVWGEEYVEDTRILRTYINQLRGKLRDSSSNPRFIRTDPGVGYRFILERSEPGRPLPE
jgi:two-component system KDP operon response regulator KdpE